MSAITNFSLGTQRLTMVIIFTIIVGGLGQFFTFPRLEDPAIVIREVVVTVLVVVAAVLTIKNRMTKRTKPLPDANLAVPQVAFGIVGRKAKVLIKTLYKNP